MNWTKEEGREIARYRDDLGLSRKDVIHIFGEFQIMSKASLAKAERGERLSPRLTGLARRILAELAQRHAETVDETWAEWATTDSLGDAMFHGVNIPMYEFEGRQFAIANEIQARVEDLPHRVIGRVIDDAGEGAHWIRISGDECRSFKKAHWKHTFVQSLNNTPTLLLLTEAGVDAVADHFYRGDSGGLVRVRRQPVSREFRPAPDFERLMPAPVAPEPVAESHGLDTIPFMGVDIPVDTERELVVLKPLCEAVGLSWEGQRKRLEAAIWADTTVTVATAGDGKRYEMAALPRDQVPMWIATVTASRIADPDAREWVERFQCECRDVLDKHWNRGAGAAPEHRIATTDNDFAGQAELVATAVGAALVPVMAQIQKSSEAMARLFEREMRRQEEDVFGIQLVTGEHAEKIGEHEERIEDVEGKIINLADRLPDRIRDGEKKLSDICAACGLLSANGKPHSQLLSALIRSHDNGETEETWMVKREVELFGDPKPRHAHVVRREHVRDVEALIFNTLRVTDRTSATHRIGNTNYTYQLLSQQQESF